jgi:hypothetical protein
MPCDSAGGGEVLSAMKKGQRFHCQNPICGCEVQVMKESHGHMVSNPQCGCGAEMKKVYVKPAARTRLSIEPETTNKLSY